MAFRIGDYVVGGFLSNRQRNSVLAWLAFDEERGIKLELTGNLPGELAGCEFEFSVQRDPQPTMDDETFKRLHVMQIGAPGDCVLRMVRVADVDDETLIRLCEEGNPPPFREVHCLYLEWYSQNGRMVAEIVEPMIEYPVTETDDVTINPEPLPEPGELDGSMTQIIAIERTESGEYIETDLSEAAESVDDDPYNLFDPGLSEQMRQSITDDDSDLDFLLDEDESETEGSQSEFTSNKYASSPSWDEVIPGIDPATKAMYEQWDEVVHGERDEPISTLFDPPIALPPVSQITTDEEAEPWVRLVVSRLALLGVAIDACEHYSTIDLYEYIMNHVIPEAQVHPQLPATGWVQHFSIFEVCEECMEEFGS